MHFNFVCGRILNTDVRNMSNIYNGGDIMPNIKSAKKRVKVIKTKTLQNQMVKSQLKTAIKKFEAALKEGKESASVAYSFVVKKTDQAVAKGILHKNTAARRKSQYAAMLNKIA